MAVLCFLGEGTPPSLHSPQPGQGTPGVSPPKLAELVTYPHPAHVTQLILVSHGVFQDLEE